MSTLIKTQGSNISISGKAVFSNPPSIDLLAGLQAFYKLSDTSDSSGNNNTLTVNGNVQFDTGKIGLAAGFDNSSYLTQALDLSTPDAFTISCWIKKAVSSGAKIILSVSSQDGPLDVYTGPSHGNGLQASFTNASAFCDLPLSENEWKHFTFIRDKVSNVSKIYMNGVDSYTSTAPSFTNANGISFGSSFGNIASDGSIDAVGIWNRALNEGEVAALYNSGNGLELN
jgi:hypothetical protein